ncbi:MAG: hypothetical protein ABJH06_03425 [Paraglaciecola sp.]|uniref:hypothetical protein n=1 Tax=Paraglaciecola sp. TaxID=1920173 RepID=UPI003299334F
MKNKSMYLTYRFISVSLIIVGATLLTINFIGLTKNIRSEFVHKTDTRFDNEKLITFEEAMETLPKGDKEQSDDYLLRLTKLISESLLHINWHAEEDTDRFHQLIPIWENYFLYFMGKFSNIPEYQKYHYADYERSIRRGVGICGDASMVMSQLLTQSNIKNKIISFPGHVVVMAQTSDNREIVLDPDYGVVLPYTLSEINQKPALIGDFYTQAGYKASDVRVLQRIYGNSYQKWSGVEHFITNKYYFEKLAYALKWPFPILLVVFGLFLMRWNMRVTSNVQG